MSSQKLQKQPEIILHNSIHTLTMDRWAKIHDLGNLEPLVISGSPTESDLLNAWDKLDDSFIKEFGISEARMQYLLKMKAYVNALCENLINSTPISVVQVKNKEAEFRTFFDSSEKAKIGKVISTVKKYMGIQYDLSKTTVYEFYNDFNLMKENGGR